MTGYPFHKSGIDITKAEHASTGPAKIGLVSDAIIAGLNQMHADGVSLNDIVGGMMHAFALYLAPQSKEFQDKVLKHLKEHLKSAKKPAP